MSRKRPTAAADPRGERGDATRQKLLTAAIDVFGRYGFDGATTRALADAAGVNLQAIPYYFGGKDGLFIATAEYITALIQSHVAELRERVRARLAEADDQGVAIGEDEARALLTEIMQVLAQIYLSHESEAWARFVIREQTEPTEAFARVYGGVMKPTLEVVGRLVAILIGEDAGTERVKLRTIALVGSLLVFRIAHAAVKAQLGWKEIGPHEVDAIRTLVVEVVASIGPQSEAS